MLVYKTGFNVGASEIYLYCFLNFEFFVIKPDGTS